MDGRLRIHFASGPTAEHYRDHFILARAWPRLALSNQRAAIRQVRALRVSARAAAALLFSRIARALTRSSIIHVAPGDDHIVASASFGGVEYFARIRFEDGAPGYLGSFVLPVPAAALDRWPPLQPIHLRHIVCGSALRLLWWCAPWSRNLGGAPDCVAITVAALEAAGMSPPRRARRSPAALHRWLLEAGHEWTAARPRA